jgi:hypothetical protein
VERFSRPVKVSTIMDILFHGHEHEQEPEDHKKDNGECLTYVGERSQ